MPSQLIKNDAVSFLVAKPLLWGDHEYEPGDEFPQEATKNIETLIRSRYLIPVVDSIEDKPRHWHREVMLREAAVEKIEGGTTQIVLPVAESPQSVPAEPEKSAADSDDTVLEPNPETPPVVEPEVTAEAVRTDTYDPSYHTVTEVMEYISSHPDEREDIIERERAGKNRKGIVEGY
jgi:hypothetical protein